MTTWYILAAATVATALLLYALMLKRKGLPGRLAAASLPLIIVMGAACAKLGYVLLLQIEDLVIWGEWEKLWDFQPKRLCFILGGAGVCLGVRWTAGWSGVNHSHALDAFAAPGALLVAGFRAAESQLGLLGAGTLVEESGIFFGAPFTVADAYGDRYVAVFFWETLAALVVMAWGMLMREDRPGLRFQRTAFALCLCQVLLENLRNQSIRWGFVYAEQLLCAVFLMVLIWLACRRKEKKRGRYRPCLWMALCLVGIVGEEFARQKGGSDLLADTGYFMMAAILAGMAIIYRRTNRTNAPI